MRICAPTHIRLRVILIRILNGPPAPLGGPVTGWQPYTNGEPYPATAMDAKSAVPTPQALLADLATAVEPYPPKAPQRKAGRLLRVVSRIRRRYAPAQYKN